MESRIWSKKIVAVLRYFRDHPHCTIFGVTGDVDNLGVYVAINGRAKAEILVDTYNRLVGSMFYDFLASNPHNFFETCFLPAGEEIFVLGTAVDKKSAESFFKKLHSANIPAALSENVPFDIGNTDITFGCSVLEKDFFTSLEPLLEAIDTGKIRIANSLYAQLLKEIRVQLSTELDRRKFASLGITNGDEIMMRNLVYLKTIQYKTETKQLLQSIQNMFVELPEAKSVVKSILGESYGLKDLNTQEALFNVLNILKEMKKPDDNVVAGGISNLQNRPFFHE